MAMRTIVLITMLLTIQSNEEALGILGVVSSTLLCSSLGSLPWKHFATETSKNADSKTVVICKV